MPLEVDVPSPEPLDEDEGQPTSALETDCETSPDQKAQHSMARLLIYWTF